jgi:hypothetical protein
VKVTKASLAQNGSTVALHGGASPAERDTGLGFYVDDISGEGIS